MKTLRLVSLALVIATSISTLYAQEDASRTELTPRFAVESMIAVNSIRGEDRRWPNNTFRETAQHYQLAAYYTPVRNVSVGAVYMHPRNAARDPGGADAQSIVHMRVLWHPIHSGGFRWAWHLDVGSSSGYYYRYSWPPSINSWEVGTRLGCRLGPRVWWQLELARGEFIDQQRYNPAEADRHSYQSIRVGTGLQFRIGKPSLDTTPFFQ